MTQLWNLRKAGEPLLHGIPGDRKPQTFVEDNAVPLEQLPRFVREFNRIVTKHGTRAAYWAHERGKKTVLPGTWPTDLSWLDLMHERGIWVKPER